MCGSQRLDEAARPGHVGLVVVRLVPVRLGIDQVAGGAAGVGGASGRLLAQRAAHQPHVDGAERRRLRGRVLGDDVDHRVAELGHGRRLPVVVAAARVVLVEELLQLRVGHAAAEVGDGRREAAQRPQADARPRRADPRRPPPPRASGRPTASAGTPSISGTLPVKAMGAISRGMSPASARSARSAGDGLRAVVEHERVGDLGADRMQEELERGDDAEVAAAAAQRPEQVRVLVQRTPGPCSPVGGHQLGGDQVVAGEAVLAPQPADAAAEREAGHPRLGDQAGRRREAVGLRRGVHLPPDRAALRPSRGAAPGRPSPRSSATGRSPRRPRRSPARRRCARRRAPRSAGRPPGRRRRPPPRRRRVAQRATATGRLSIIPFHTDRAVSYPSSPAPTTSPVR